MKIVLFFTRPVSLNTWIQTGLYDREIELYKKYVSDGHNVTFITYGINDVSRLDINDKMIKVLKPPLFVGWFGKIGLLIYSLISPIIHYFDIRDADVFKSNQFDGAWSAWISSLFYKGRFYFRTGYTYSRFNKKDNYIKRTIMGFLESFLYKQSDFSSVSSQNDSIYLTNKLKISPMVLGNFICIDKFSIITRLEKRADRFIFVGRMNDQKNIFSMLDAVKKTGLGIDLYGDGELKHSITEYIAQNNIDAKLKGRVSNDQLPDILNKYKYFILVSHYEGMPKSLLEAMSCGCICIVSDVPGNCELIINGRDGFVSSQTTSASIYEAICNALCSSKLEISNAARNKIVSNYSLHVIYDKEISLLNGELCD